MNSGTRPDPDWRGYLEEFCPTAPKHKQQILNINVIEELRRAGDSLTVRHIVDHTILFRRAVDRERFGGLAASEGFAKLSDFENERDSEWPCGSIVANDMIITLNEINRVSWKLIDLVEQVGGRYDGWGTTAILK